jgi:hypothetical protein
MPSFFVLDQALDAAQNQRMNHEQPRPPLTNEQAIAKLRQCRDLLSRMDQSGQGIFYQPSEEELKLLHGYEEVANEASARPDGEGWFDEIRRRAGLAPSGMLSGVLQQWYASHISPEAQIEQLKRTLASTWERKALDE